MRRVLVTGFGAFPGAAVNPSEQIVGDLRRERIRFGRLGCDLRCAVLPVHFAELDERLTVLAQRHRPDAILHIGVAVRRERVSVEACARNCADPLAPDAAGQRSPPTLVAGGPPVLAATYPSLSILKALSKARLAAELSDSAGDYVCNAALYRSLHAAHAAETGFLHVPRPCRAASTDRHRLRYVDLATAARLAVLVLARVPTDVAVRLSRTGLPPCGA